MLITPKPKGMTKQRPFSFPGVFCHWKERDPLRLVLAEAMKILHPAPVRTSHRTQHSSLHRDVLFLGWRDQTTCTILYLLQSQGADISTCLCLDKEKASLSSTISQNRSKCIQVSEWVWIRRSLEAELSIIPTYPALVYIAELSEHFIEFLLDETKLEDILQERSWYTSTVNASLSVGPN